MALEKIFKKCESFDVADLQLRVELHLTYRSFLTFSLLNYFCEIVHFQKEGLVSLIPPPLAAPVLTTPEF